MKYYASIFLFYFIFQSIWAQPKAQLTGNPPILNCVKNETSNQISIQWAAPANAGGACFKQYNIYVSNNRTGSYQLLTSITDSSSGSLTIDPTLPGVVYLYMINEQLCSNPSNSTVLTSDTLDNLTPQPPIQVLKITVENEHPVIYWKPSKNPEVTDYAIFSIENGYNTAIDTVHGRSTNSYTNLHHNPADSAAVYKIRSIEYCEDTQGLYSNITAAYNTIRLKNGEENLCKRSTLLDWNGYNNQGLSVLGYKVEYSTDNGLTFLTKDTLPQDARQYDFVGLKPLSINIIRVVAMLPGGDESWSNAIHIISKGAVPADHHYIRNITVTSDHVELEYVPDPLAEIKDIVLERSTNGQVFSVLNTAVSIQEPTGMGPYVIRDFSALTNRTSLYYKVTVKNSCAQQFSTLPAKTILLKGKNLGLSNHLTWDSSIIDQDTIISYNLWRYSSTDTTLVYSTDTATTYSDQNVYAGGQFADYCYLVEAKHFATDTSRVPVLYSTMSNMVCLHPVPQAFVPNAFAPMGYNKIFKPILVFSSNQDYTFQIFDRNGHKVFETHDLTQGWDGTISSVPAPLDSYLYHLKFTGMDGVSYRKDGYVILIK